MIFFDNTNMQIPYLPFLDSNDLRQAGEQLNKIDFHRIGQNNWPEQFPYTPYAAFTMAHNGEMLFIRFKVDETSTMALTREDNEQVCNDSCVEFFLAVDDSGYYNFEFTCIGKTLLGFRKERPAAVHAPEGYHGLDSPLFFIGRGKFRRNPARPSLGTDCGNSGFSSFPSQHRYLAGFESPHQPL